MVARIPSHLVRAELRLCADYLRAEFFSIGGDLRGAQFLGFGLACSLMGRA